MHVEKLKYLIWAQDLPRAVEFYRAVFGGEIVRRSDVMAEFRIGGSTLGIHGGGEGKRTWTGLAFQVGDLSPRATPFARPAAECFASPRTRRTNQRISQCAWTPRVTKSC